MSEQKVSRPELMRMYKYIQKNPETFLDMGVWRSFKELEDEVGGSGIFSELESTLNFAAKENNVSPKTLLNDFLDGKISLAPTDKADREREKFYSGKR